jgi:hypothetical protein
MSSGRSGGRADMRHLRGFRRGNGRRKSPPDGFLPCGCRKMSENIPKMTESGRNHIAIVDYSQKSVKKKQ